MEFLLSAYSLDVVQILARDGDGLRPMPLVAKGCASPEARAELKKWQASNLFPDARSPEGALAGLYLYYSCEEEAHAISQDLNTPEGNFWHGILHRQEPDAFNAEYWFQKVGRHPVFPALSEQARLLGFAGEQDTGKNAAGPWDPVKFIAYCESARTRPGSNEERLAMQVQLVEWQLLFDYCAREKTR